LERFLLVDVLLGFTHEAVQILRGLSGYISHESSILSDSLKKGTVYKIIGCSLCFEPRLVEPHEKVFERLLGSLIQGYQGSGWLSPDPPGHELREEHPSKVVEVMDGVRWKFPKPVAGVTREGKWKGSACYHLGCSVEVHVST
jgi:hypothetical protein